MDNEEKVNEYYPFSAAMKKTRKENILHMIRSSEVKGESYSRKLYEYGSRRMVEGKLYKELLLPLKTNKVFCSEWLSDHEIIMGTKCNCLLVYNVDLQRFSRVKEPKSSSHCLPLAYESGIHALAINPSRTLLVSGGPHSNDVAVYSLPDLKPVCVGECAHKDWIFDVKWIDDDFFVTGARDGTVALWCASDSFCVESRDYYYIKPVKIRTCQLADKVRALSFKPLRYLTALSSNSYLHKWDMVNFEQVSSHKLPYCCENVCLTQSEDRSIFAIGSSAHVTFIDSKTYGLVKNIRTKCRGSSVRSLSFRGDLLTIGTGVGNINFFDLRAGRYLDQVQNVTHTINEPPHPGFFADITWSFFEGMVQTAIYTHCYDQSGTRFFAGGGPLTVDVQGCYAALWQ